MLLAESVASPPRGRGLKLGRLEQGVKQASRDAEFLSGPFSREPGVTFPCRRTIGLNTGADLLSPEGAASLMFALAHQGAGADRQRDETTELGEQAALLARLAPLGFGRKHACVGPGAPRQGRRCRE